MKIIVGIDKGSYSLDAGLKRITIKGFKEIKLEQIISITDITAGRILYSNQSFVPKISIENNTIMYNSKITGVKNNDILQIILEFPIAYDSIDDMYKIKTMQKKFRDEFPSPSIDLTKWDVTVGPGMNASVSNKLVITTGTTPESITELFSKEIFTIPFKIHFNLMLSQRITNQSVYIGAVSVDPETGVPDNKSNLTFLFDGTSATGLKYISGSNGIATMGAATVVQSTTTGNGIFEIEPFADEVWFHTKTINTTTQRTNSLLNQLNVPDSNAVYKIFIRIINGSTAPASSTTFTLPFIACQDYAEVTAEITAGRGQSAEGQSLGVRINNTPNVNVTNTPTVVANRPTPTMYSVTSSLGTTNYAVVKASAGTIFNISVFNNTATTKYLKLYNRTSATIGTDIPIVIIPISPGFNNIAFGEIGYRFATGICIAITGNQLHTDTTALVAGDLLGLLMSYI